MLKFLRVVFLGALLACGKQGTAPISSGPRPESAAVNHESSAPKSPPATSQSFHDGDSFQNGDPVFPQYRYQIRKFYWRKYGTDTDPEDLGPLLECPVTPENIPDPQFI